MEQQKPMIVCALYASPHLGHCPRKIRSGVIGLGPKRRLIFDDAPLSRKRRRLMFNETVMANVNFQVNFNCRRDEGVRKNSMMILGSEKNGEQDDQVGQECALLHCAAQMGKHGLGNDICTPRKGKGKMIPEEEREVVGPQTPSPAKWKRGRGSINSRINQLQNSKEKRLKCIAKNIENAHYYTRSVNKLLVNELLHGKRRIGQTSSFTEQQRKSITWLKQKKKVQQFDLVVERNATQAWKALLSKGATTGETFGKPWNNDDGICPEVSFIHRVGTIQGQRVYLPWKGSVLDSVIGTLLSQRVRDGTSSSAFMTLGMIFPQHPSCDLYERHHRILREKRSNACSYEGQQGNGNKLGKQGRVLVSEMRKGRVSKTKKPKVDWHKFREDCIGDGGLERDADKIDYVDWYAVLRADVEDVAAAISSRGMNKKLAARIKDFLNRLVLDHGNLDLEWLRNASPQEAKDFLLSIYGFGLKSAECVQLLTLRQPAFPVDVNVARVTVRLGWVPAPLISDDVQMHLLRKSSKLHDLIHQHLWLRLSRLHSETLYQLHCHMITFGKVFCTNKPRCGECPMRLECKYFSNRADGPSTSFHVKDIEDLGSSRASVTKREPAMSKCKVKEATIDALPLDRIEAPKTPIKVPLPRFRRNTSAKTKQPVRIKTRTEHFIYELHDWHPILETFDDRDPDDVSPYLLVTWESDLEKPVQTLDKKCPSNICVRGSRVVPGTIMIPYRTALRGNFPLNATYFQANEVFADRQTSQIPVDVRCRTLQGLPRKTLYCGVNLSEIVKGRTATDLHSLFHEGYICTRSFDRETYATGTLDNRLHKPSSAKTRTPEKKGG